MSISVTGQQVSTRVMSIDMAPLQTHIAPLQTCIGRMSTCITPMEVDGRPLQADLLRLPSAIHEVHPLEMAVERKRRQVEVVVGHGGVRVHAHVEGLRRQPQHRSTAEQRAGRRTNGGIALSYSNARKMRGANGTRRPPATPRRGYCSRSPPWRRVR